MSAAVHISAAVHTARCWIQHPTARRPSAAHSSQIISVALWQRCAAGEPAGKGCSEPCEGTKEVKPAGRVHRAVYQGGNGVLQGAALHAGAAGIQTGQPCQEHAGVKQGTSCDQVMCCKCPSEWAAAASVQYWPQRKRETASWTVSEDCSMADDQLRIMHQLHCAHLRCSSNSTLHKQVGHILQRGLGWPDL